MENFEQEERSQVEKKAVMKKKLIHAFISGILIGVGFVVLVMAVAMLA